MAENPENLIRFCASFKAILMNKINKQNNKQKTYYASPWNIVAFREQHS